LNKNYDDTIKKTQANKDPNQNHKSEKLPFLQVKNSRFHENIAQLLSIPAGREQADPEKSYN